MAMEFFMDSDAVCSSDKNAKVIRDKKKLLHLIFDNFSNFCRNVVEPMDQEWIKAIDFVKKISHKLFQKQHPFIVFKSYLRLEKNGLYPPCPDGHHIDIL